MQHIETKTNRGPFETRIFDSIAEFIDAIKQVPAKRIARNDHVSDEDDSFTGRKFDGWEDVYAKLQEPWQDGLDILDRMMGDLRDANLPAPKSRKRRTRFSEDNGDELDYDRLRSGRSFWRESRRESTSGPATITVMVDVATSASVKARDIIWRGAAAIAMTKMLEAAGFRVELWAVSTANDLWDNSITGMTAVKMKGPSDPLDTVALINLVSGWGFRTAWFRAFCMGKKEVAYGLGYPTRPRPDEQDFISRDENRVMISGAFSYDSAVEVVRNAIGKIAGFAQTR